MSIKTKLLTSAVALSMVAAMGIQSAKAEQLWDPYLRGVNEGLAAGALPPPGVYGVLNNYWADYALYGANGKKVQNTHLTALVEVPVVLWVPGIKVLGADYAAAAALPFDYTSFQGTQGLGHTGGGNLGLFNAVVVPGILSWALPDNFFVKTGLEFYLPTGTNSFKDLAEGKMNNGGLPSAMGFFAVQPDLGFSYLNGPWNLSAGFNVSFPVTDDKYNGISYHSGDEFSADYTAMYTMGKWAFGVGAEQQDQFTPDTQNGLNVHNEVHDFGMGPLVSYQLGTVNVLAEWNHGLVTQNQVAGDIFNIRLLTKF
ncbi:transporter [Acidocella sp.]|uniref:SphA family protein n=1 Tax=Acidocella sp. TaxID=50710 RepID=UPI00260C2172|nr:transporter [Acidocella sp.]